MGEEPRVSERRRREMLDRLTAAERPVTGTELATRLGVSRQIVVQDIAILRASGAQIVATPRGYVVNRSVRHAYREVIAAVHTREQIADELNILVDHGVRVLDVIVE